MYNRTTPERFYAKAVRVGDCLIWQGKGRIGPYGVAGYQRKNWLAHRLSYFFANDGDLSAEEVVRHICDTPLCVEPSHLLKGTHAENVQDKVDRLRHGFGEAHPNRKLTFSEVEAIRAAYSAGGVTQKELARRFGASRTQLHRIVHGSRWGIDLSAGSL